MIIATSETSEFQISSGIYENQREIIQTGLKAFRYEKQYSNQLRFKYSTLKALLHLNRYQKY